LPVATITKQDEAEERRDCDFFRDYMVFTVSLYFYYYYHLSVD